MGLRLQRYPTKVGSYSLPQQSTGLQNPADYVTDASDIKLPHSRDIKKKSLHRLKAKNRVIVQTQGEDVYFYRRLPSGRRCSCFDTYETPDADCPICLKTGIVGGYLKYGTHENILDATYPGVSLIGMHLSYETQLRPLNFILDEGVKEGKIYWRFDILQTNKRVVDGIRFLYSGVTKSSHVTAYVKRPSDSDFILEATAANIETLLTEEFLDFKILVSRTNRNIPSPKVSHFQLRYNILSSLLVRVDIQNVSGAIQLEELGYFSNVETAQSFFDSTLGYINSNDFMYRLDRNQFWKPINDKENEVLRITTGIETTLRVIQPIEPYVNILV